MWQPIDANTPPPLDKPILLWFIGRNAPQSAHACAIGSASSHQPGEVWIDGDYRPIEWFSHWQPLPDGPIVVVSEDGNTPMTDEDLTRSAPVFAAPHNTGEREPSVMPDSAGAGTGIPRCP